jgi:hypothetical protein
MMKRTWLIGVMMVLLASALGAADEPQYREMLRTMVHADEDPLWFSTFAEEAARVLLRERVSLRTMEIIQASIGRDVLPEDPSDAAAAYCMIAKEADALLRRGGTPARVALTTRVRLERSADGVEPPGPGAGQSSSPGDTIRESRAKDAINAAKEQKAGAGSPGRGPK